MLISDFLSRKCVLSNVDCHSKKDALDTLARMIANSDNTISQAEVFDCLLARERLGGTGLGNGIAIPHGRLALCKKTLGAFIQLKNPIDYDAVDKLPVDLLFALIAPEDATDEHLHILATLAGVLGQDSVVGSLRMADSQDALYSILME